MGCGSTKNEDHNLESTARKHMVGITSGNFFDHYYLEDKLSKTNFTDVWTAVHRITKELRAVKIIKKSILQHYTEAFDIFISGLDSILRTDSPNLIRILEIIEDNSKYYIVTELLQGKPLLQHIGSLPPEKITEKLIAGYMSQIISALAYCHEKGIVHKDIRPDHIMFKDKEGKIIKLAGLGLEVIEGEADYQTYVFKPPETILEKKYDFKSDVWGCGVLCYRLLHGSEYPFFICPKAEVVYEQIKSMEIVMASFSGPKWDVISEDAKKFIIKCLIKDPEKRPTTAELLQDPWIKNARNIPLDPSLAKKYLELLMSGVVFFA